MEGDTVTNKGDCNEDINANSPQMEPSGSWPRGGSDTVVTTRRKTCVGIISSLLSIIWFGIQCLLCHAVLLVLMALFLPFTALFCILKAAERIIVKMKSDAMPLNASDAAWVPSHNENNLNIINALVCFENKDSFEEGVRRIHEAILERMVDASRYLGMRLYPRVRSYIRPAVFQYFFEEDQSFEIDNHVFTWKGEKPRSKDELAAIVSTLSNEPFPEGRSPWCCCCIPTHFGDNDVAALFRMQHALADGVSLVRFLVHQLPDKATPQGRLQNYSSAGRLLLMAKGVLIAPRYLFKMLFTDADKNLLHGPELSGERKTAWNEAIELKLIKEIKTATGTTVNDVLMSCLSLALRKYFQRKGVANPDDFTAAVPVDVRASASSKKLALENKFAFIFLKLAVATEGALNQLFETKDRMDKAKISGEPLASAILSRSQALNTHSSNAKTNTYLSRKASCVLTNVRGPQEMLTVRGSRIKYMVFWPPLKDNVAVALSILTYAGKVFVGVQGDKCVLSDPEIIAEEFENAVNEMARFALQTKGIVNEGYEIHLHP